MSVLGFELTAATVEALSAVGLVLVESLVLYLGYGALTRAAGPAVREAVGGT